MQTFLFGWLPEVVTYEGTMFRIEPLLSTPRSFDYILNSLRVKDDWFYPMLEPEFSAPGSIGEPLIYTDLFALPATHRITFNDGLDDASRCAAFAVEILGVLKGMQLLLDGWGHFYRTPIQTGVLGDIKYVEPDAVIRVLDKTFEFWSHNPSVRNVMYGAIHWHLFGCSYEHAFERFGAAYAVLDSCWAVHKLLGNVHGRVTHAARLPMLCGSYDLHLPEWGAVQNGRSRLSELRNEYFHESLWGGKPIGLGHPQDVPSIHLELFYLNTRLILAMLGDQTDYTASHGAYEPYLLA